MRDSLDNTSIALQIIASLHQAGRPKRPLCLYNGHMQPAVYDGKTSKQVSKNGDDLHEDMGSRAVHTYSNAHLETPLPCRSLWGVCGFGRILRLAPHLPHTVSLKC